MLKYPFTEYGITVKNWLMEQSQTQEWLIAEIKKRTNMFVDSSVLNKVLTGRTNSQRITSTISEIMNEKG